MISYSQNLEDVMLARAFANRPSGFYIDVGAMDPVEGSVTKHFYDQGWHGVNIEPDPRFHERLGSARPRDVNLCIAVGAQDEQRIFYEFDDPGLSTFDADFAAHFIAEGRTYRVAPRTLTTLGGICADHGVRDIDFLKIDAEGWEGPILAGADWNRWRPQILVIEATRPFSHTANWYEWEPGLLEKGYEMVYFDGLNRFYVSSDHAELQAAFRFPPNVLDSYKPYSVVLLEQRASELERTIGRLTAELQQARLFAGQLSQECAKLNGLMQDKDREIGGLAVHIRDVEAELHRERHRCELLAGDPF